MIEIPMIVIGLFGAGIALSLFGSLGLKHKQNISDEVGLLLFYGSFDKDQDGTLSINEIISFFKWCKANIEYEPHGYFRSPLKTFRTRRGNCLDQALLIAHCLSFFYRFPGYIGCIMVKEGHKRVKHACCLLPVSKDNKNQIDRKLGYEVSCFNVSNDKRCFIIIDPLYCDKFGKLETTDYNLIEIRTLRDFPFNNMTGICSRR